MHTVTPPETKVAPGSWNLHRGLRSHITYRNPVHSTVLTPHTSAPLFIALDDPGQADEGLRRAKEADKQRQVSEVADHLRDVNPNAPITDAGRYCTAVLVAGTVGRVRPLLRALPHVDSMPAGTTRRAYADHLTTSVAILAGACG